MTLAEIKQAARDAINKRADLGLNPAAAHVMLTLPGRWGRRMETRLAGRRGPKGRIVADVGSDDSPRIMVDFMATDVLAWIDAMERIL